VPSPITGSNSLLRGIIRLISEGSRNSPRYSTWPSGGGADQLERRAADFIEATIEDCAYHAIILELRPICQSTAATIIDMPSKQPCTAG